MKFINFEVNELTQFGSCLNLRLFIQIYSTHNQATLVIRSDTTQHNNLFVRLIVVAVLWPIK